VKNIFDWTILGRATSYEKKFQDRPKIFLFLKSYMTLKYLLIIDFPKFDPTLFLAARAGKKLPIM
jgi:hypothetical protein